MGLLSKLKGLFGKGNVVEDTTQEPINKPPTEQVYKDIPRTTREPILHQSDKVIPGEPKVQPVPVVPVDSTKTTNIPKGAGKTVTKPKPRGKTAVANAVDEASFSEDTKKSTPKRKSSKKTTDGINATKRKQETKSKSKPVRLPKKKTTTRVKNTAVKTGGTIPKKYMSISDIPYSAELTFGIGNLDVVGASRTRGKSANVFQVWSRLLKLVTEDKMYIHQSWLKYSTFAKWVDTNTDGINPYNITIDAYLNNNRLIGPGYIFMIPRSVSRLLTVSGDTGASGYLGVSKVNGTYRATLYVDGKAIRKNGTDPKDLHIWYMEQKRKNIQSKLRMLSKSVKINSKLITGYNKYIC